MTLLAHACDRSGASVVAAAGVFFVLALVLSVTDLRLEPNRHDFTATTSAFRQRYQEFTREFPLQENAIVAITSSDVVRNHRVAEAVAERLRGDRKHFAAVYERIDTRFVRERLLLFAPQADLTRILKDARRAGPLLRLLIGRPGLTNAFAVFDRTLNELVARVWRERQVRAVRPSSAWQGQVEGAAGLLPVLSTTLADMTAAVVNGTPYRSRWQEIVSRHYAEFGIEGVPDTVYLELQHGKTCLILVRPRPPVASNASADFWVAVLRRHLTREQEANRAVRIGLTGMPVMDYDMLRTAADDSLRATVLSFIGICVLFALTFRDLKPPLLACACLVLALVWTLGFTALSLGFLDSITVIAMPMLIGLGIDFSIQVMARYDEERAGGRVPPVAMEKTLTGTGTSVIAASLTIAVCFSATALTGLPAMRSLAVVATAGILLCAVAMVVVFPACILRQDRGERPPTLRGWLVNGLAGMEHATLVHAPGVLFLAFLGTILCLRLAPHVGFDGNLMHLQARGVGSVQWEHLLADSGGHGVIPAAVVASDLAQARRLQQQLEPLPAVAGVVSVASLFPLDPAAKVKTILELQAALPRRFGPETAVTAANLPRLLQSVQDLRDLFLMLYPAAEHLRQPVLLDGMREFVHQADAFMAATRRYPATRVAARLQVYQHAALADLATILAWVQAHAETRPLEIATLPSILRNSVVSGDGRVLVAVFPRGDIWNPGTLKDFVTEVRRLAPDVTGFPVEVYESSGVVQARFIVACGFAALAVGLVTLLHFRSLVPTLLATGSVVLGVVWMLGVQAWWHWPFNPANQIAVPLLLGIGTANGIYVVRRWQEEGRPRILSVSTGRAIILSNGMAIIGFGSLLGARYQGMASIGIVMVVGLGSCIVSSLVVLPAVLECERRFAAWGHRRGS